MARVSIYVTDDLKAQIDELRDALNWSDIARSAFEIAIANHRKTRGITMSAIERLRESKNKYEHHVEISAQEDGREWAAKRASYVELRDLSKLDISGYEADTVGVLRDFYNVNNYNDALPFDVWVEGIFGTEDVSNDWAYHFIRGAQNFFNEIKDQL